MIWQDAEQLHLKHRHMCLCVNIATAK